MTWEHLIAQGNPDGKLNEKVAYNWYWDEEDPERPGLPTDFATRFRERLL